MHISEGRIHCLGGVVSGLNIPTSGSSSAYIIGQQLGSAGAVRYRLSSSALASTFWLSDSSIRVRMFAGVSILNETLTLSVPGHHTTRFKAVVSFGNPLSASVIAQSFSNISIIGSNFGPHIAVVARTSGGMAYTEIQPNTEVTICKSVEVDAGSSITDAVVSIVFSRPTRLDDVSILLRSSTGKDYKLMHRKCYGALPCSALVSVAFDFQILPVSQYLNAVPTTMCPNSDTYIPDDVHSLRSALASETEKGAWSLRVVTGSQSQTVSFASIFLKTTVLEFRIGNSSTTSLAWFSDSSVSVKAPGYLSSQEIESSSGLGRNHSVVGYSFGRHSKTACVYSYPDPKFTDANVSSGLTSSGSSRLLLFGRHFANVASNVRGRISSTTCATTFWISDTALSCFHSPSIGSIHPFAVTLVESEIAILNSDFSFLSTRMNKVNLTFVSVVTAGSSVTVHGAGFGIWDSSVRVRALNTLSSAHATIWNCDSRISAKLLPFILNMPGITISLGLGVKSTSLMRISELQPSMASTFEKTKVPSTGSTCLGVAGAGFGLFASSIKISIGGSSCLESIWMSSTSINCKTPNGMRLNSLSVVTTVSRFRGNDRDILLFFDPPAANESSNMFSNISEVCFNATGCITGRFISVEHASSGFGTSTLPLRRLSLTQGSETKPCNISSWISDSSVHCFFAAFISPEFPDFQVVIEPIISRITIKNPFFIPAPPSLSNETIHFRFYQNLVYPEGIDQSFQRFGTTSGFIWADSSLSPSVEFSQVLTFSLLIYIRASQFFMDSNFLPIETSIFGSVAVWDAQSNVSSMILCDKLPKKIFNFVVAPKRFWAKLVISLALCSPQHFVDRPLKLRAEANVQNAKGAVILMADSPTFYAKSSGTPSIVFSHNPVSKLNAGSVYNEILAFRVLYGTSLDNICEHVGSVSFKYSMSLVCAGKESDFRSSMPHAGALMESTTCLLNVSNVMFIAAASSCSFNVSVQTNQVVFKVSPVFDVVSGLAKLAMLIGGGPFCASASARVWSVNSSLNGLCLVAQLQDSEGNNITSAAEAIVVARHVNSFEPNYKVARGTKNLSSTSGLILWCDAYSSVTHKEGVYFGANVSGIVSYWTSSVIKVSAAGAPANIEPNVTAAMLRSTSLPGSAPPKIDFALRDTYGNDLSSGIEITIRVRVIPRRNSTIGRSAASILRGDGRRLLQHSSSSCDAAESTDVPLFFDFTVKSTSNQISVGPEFLCRTGANDVYFDIGTVSEGLFKATFPNAFQMNVTVLPGDFRSFMPVPFPSAFVVQSYTLIDSLEIIFLDSGLNEVIGNASMSLVCSNKSAVVYPSEMFAVKSTATVKAIVPPFFVHVLEWTPADFPFDVRIAMLRSNGSVPQHGPASVALKLRPTCFPGNRIESLPFPDLLNASLANSAVKCIPCLPFFSTWHYDAARCLTLRWPEAPHVVQSGLDVVVSGVSLRDELALVIPYSDIFLTTTMVRGSTRRNQTSCRSRVINGVSQSCTIQRVVYQESPGLDYKWMLELFAANTNVPLFTLLLPTDKSVAVLDFAPVVDSVVPSSLSFIGGQTITLVGRFPQNMLPERVFAQNVSLPALFSDRCIFVSKREKGNVTLTVAANRSVDSSNAIVFECRSLASGDSGPPFTSWLPSMALADGRNSTIGGNAVHVFCPKGHYMETSAVGTPVTCQQCPFQRSISFAENQMFLKSCVCNVGYYGTFGDSCVACPKVQPASDGFNCSLANQSRPAILPGYYIDYSLLNKCSEYGSKCSAIISCPNPAACPGTKEKDCVQNEMHCYDTETFGCTSCCPRFYMENLKCFPCPASQLPLVLGFAIVGLLIFAVFSSSFDFPPILSAIQSLKVFLGGMQAYVAIRLIDIPWPPIVLKMFDFTRFFTFSFDVIRPECTVDYSPQAKLIFVLIGPFMCSLFIIGLILMYSAFKCFRISKLLQHESVQRLHSRSLLQTAAAVVRCLLVSSMCLKFSNTRMMIDGALWNALNPSLAQRVNMSVLNQRKRRRTVFGSSQRNISEGCGIKSSVLPEDWVQMQMAVSELDVENEFARSAKRFRLLLASSLSIFIFTFQGCIEAALSTFDCKNMREVLFLRSNPKVRCSSEDEMYYGMLAITFAGMVIYCFLLPLTTIITLRSQWCREAYIHDNTAYRQIFGFLTSLYSLRWSLWELVACARKVLLVVIPVVVSREPLVQSVSIFLWLILYTFVISRVQPMATSSLNHLEVLSCTSVIVGSFSSIFFVIEYQGVQLLRDSSRDMAGLFLVLICAICTLLSLQLIFKEYSSMFYSNQNTYSSHDLQD
jgi:hypothetical protein